MFFGRRAGAGALFAEPTERAQAESVNYIVLRVKRLQKSGPGMPWSGWSISSKKAESLGITVLLAGGAIRIWLEALHRLRFEDWFPRDQMLPQGSDEDSADARRRPQCVRAARRC